MFNWSDIVWIFFLLLVLLQNVCLNECCCFTFCLYVQDKSKQVQDWRKGESASVSGQMVKDPDCHLELIRSTVLVFWL